MIVRCTKCVSAFAVDDEKVANKKFAFTCPKCGTENIFDNRKHEPSKDDMSFEQDIHEEIPDIKRKPAAVSSSIEEDIFFEDTPSPSDKKENKPAPDDFFSEEIPLNTEQPKKKINLEIEESAPDDLFFDEEEPVAAKKSSGKAPAEEEILFDDDDLLADVKPSKKAPVEEEILFDDDDLLADVKPSKKAPAEEELFFEEDELPAAKKPAKKPETEDDLLLADLDLDLDEKSVKPEIEEEDIILDDFTVSETPVPKKKKPSADEDFPELAEALAEEKAPAEAKDELIFDDEIFADEIPVKKAQPSAEDDILFDDEVLIEDKPSKKAPVEEEILFEEDELLAEEKPAKKAPVDEEIFFEEDELLAEEKPAKKAPVEEEIFFEEDELLAEEKPAKKIKDEEELFLEDLDLDLELDEKPAKQVAEDELIFDDDFIVDESETPSEAPKKKDDEDLFSEIGLELKEEPDREVRLSSQDDIDALFASAPADTPVKPSKKDIPPEDDITVDLDELDIELEEEGAPSADEFVTFDEDGKAEHGKTGKTEDPAFDDDITIDMDALDIEIEEAGDYHKPETEPAQKRKPVAMEQNEEELVLNIDEFGEDIEAAREVPSSKAGGKKISEDEDITLDLDSLDIDLDESEAVAPKIKKSKAQAFDIEDSISSEEELKLNLDEMDVDIEELEKKELVFDDDEIPDAPVKKHVKKQAAIEEDEDESITIDLDTLDIEVSESQDVIAAEMTEEEEKLTLDDAGLTFNELTGDEIKAEVNAVDEEDIKLTLDEIDPELKLKVIGETAPKNEKPLIDTIEELPEIDLDEYEAVIREEELHAEKTDYEIGTGGEVYLDLEVPETAEARREIDLLEIDEEIESDYLPEKGSTTFSIDYSLKYSRIGAILRLLGLYTLSMIPHFILVLVYTILSGIIGFINQIVILSTGRCVEDFSQITENTLRYYLYIQTNITGIVEDRPVYAGRDSINHQLQLNVTYPVKYSRNFAILRLSIIGIWLIMLPHFIIMSMLTVFVPFVYLAGIIMVIITSRWPNPLFIFLTRYYRYAARLLSFLIGLTDEYPPFSFD